MPSITDVAGLWNHICQATGASLYALKKLNTLGIIYLYKIKNKKAEFPERKRCAFLSLSTTLSAQRLSLQASISCAGRAEPQTYKSTNYAAQTMSTKCQYYTARLKATALEGVVVGNTA